MYRRANLAFVISTGILSRLLIAAAMAQPYDAKSRNEPTYRHEESPSEPWLPRSSEVPTGVTISCEPVMFGPYVSIQVNVNEFGCNIPGDAANEPSIAVDPIAPRRIAIGWRQFDSIASSFRQAGWGYSNDAGHTWMFPGVLRPGVFGSDPVLSAGPEGQLYYLTLSNNFDCFLFKSFDGGVSWDGPVFAYGGDKEWMVVDRSNSIGRGHIYVAAAGTLSRSTNGGASFEDISDSQHDARLGYSNMAVGPAGEWFVGTGYVSYDALDAGFEPTFIELGNGGSGSGGGAFDEPNPEGLIGQLWIAIDASGEGAFHGMLYLIVTGDMIPPNNGPTQILFSRSPDGGFTWSPDIQINNDVAAENAWHWFGTMSLAPNGRIDVVWNDTRNTGQANLCQLFYAYSIDAGDTWQGNVPVSPVFDSHLGWPNQQKIGDYYHMVSDNLGVNIAYAATFNGEQDVYFLRIGPYDCNGNEIPDENDIADGTILDCNENEVPDECEYRGDFNGDRLTALDDYFAYTQCRTVPGVEYATPCCGLFDIEPDGDADLADFAFVQRAFAMPGP